MDNLENIESPMTATQGAAMPARGSFSSDLVELVSSMRFAISLLTVIAIASIIGTVVLQNEPLPKTLLLV
jgi:cytochrome c biogenesis protein